MWRLKYHRLTISPPTFASGGLFLLIMENYLGKIVKLKQESMIELLGEEKARAVKFGRPFLIIGLTYKNKMQSFAVPIMSNIRPNFNEVFWHKLPNRLGTELGNRCRLNYFNMFPIYFNDIERIRDSDNKILCNKETQEKILKSLVLREMM